MSTTTNIRLIEIYEDAQGRIATMPVGFPKTRKDAFSIAERLAGEGAKFYCTGTQMYQTMGYAGERQIELVEG